MAGRKKRCETFMKRDKIALLKAVEMHPELWDIRNKMYYNAIVARSAWEHIARTLNKETDECKVAWASLRDSFRYHMKSPAAKRAKGGSADGSALSTPVYIQSEWEFSEHMAFLPLTSSRTINRSECKPEVACTSAAAAEYAAMDDLSNDFVYSETGSEFTDSPNKTEEYFDKPKKVGKRKSEQEVPQEADSKCISEFMSLQAEIVDSIKNLQQAHQSAPPEPVESYFLYWRSIFATMSPTRVERTIFLMSKVALEQQEEQYDEENLKKKKFKEEY